MQLTGNEQIKYPRTPYWISSPSVPKDGRYVSDPEKFVNTTVIITEKLDGSTTLLHRGEVYGRNGEISHFPWHGMARKHHAWKTSQPGFEIEGEPAYLWGEDIYGVHSIRYDPVPEEKTFYAFALMLRGRFQRYDWMTWRTNLFDIPVAPVLSLGTFPSVDALNKKIEELHFQPSALGGELEGVVIRTYDKSFAVEDFADNVCKSVRKNHVQVDAVHWRRNWKPCELKRS